MSSTLSKSKHSQIPYWPKAETNSPLTTRAGFDDACKTIAWLQTKLTNGMENRRKKKKFNTAHRKRTRWFDARCHRRGTVGRRGTRSRAARGYRPRAGYHHSPVPASPSRLTLAIWHGMACSAAVLAKISLRL